MINIISNILKKLLKFNFFCIYINLKFLRGGDFVKQRIKLARPNRHKPRNQNFCTQNIQEWCNSCSEISYFKQIVKNHIGFDCIVNYYEKQQIKYCKLCGKLIYQQIPLYYIKFKLCSECYQISSGWVESSLTKKTIPILYLPWWDACDQCAACDQILEFDSDCQKWCSCCGIIYTGCRYCLTTNIIF